ncbi:hypothetical protein HF086_009621 [Spodoptera exigua]|uniref:Uncharacterized protein n=1 Tax=Spodoptera exigua TaxID=7107 RepID=A0A922MIF8_SPOEX|nr:hypothetical protein HF086_009621 [Spodoptera exigua]
MGDRGRRLVQLACNKPLISDTDADDNIMEIPPKNLCQNSSLQDIHDIAGPSTLPNDVDIISNSSSDLDFAQLDIVLNMKNIIQDKGTSSNINASTSQKNICYASDTSSDKNCLFGSDYSDIDPTYVPDSDENIQNDTESDCNVIIPESPNMEKCDNKADKEFIILILENLLDRVWLSVKPLTRRKRAEPKEWKRNINSFGVYHSADQRGKKEKPNKTNPEDIAFVQKHIESFPVMESHYCRKDSRKKKYLAPDVKSINNMYTLYQELCKDSDLCNICSKYEKTEPKEDFEEEYQEHLKRKKICQAEKDSDKVRANTDESFMSITMDLQAVLQIPSGGETLLLWAVQKIDHLNIIEQKFLESGHTHMEVDSMHAAIEAASKNKTINSVSEWKNIFTAARKKRTKTITKEQLPISLAKKKDLMKMCEKLIIPEELHAWVRDMKTYNQQPAFESDEE